MEVVAHIFIIQCEANLLVVDSSSRCHRPNYHFGTQIQALSLIVKVEMSVYVRFLKAFTIYVPPLSAVMVKVTGLFLVYDFCLPINIKNPAWSLLLFPNISHV